MPISYASTAGDWDAERKEGENNSLNQAHASLETEPNSLATNSMLLLQTHALTAALLSTWGLSIYISAAPQGTQCPWLDYTHVVLLEWLALGCFFVTVCASLC